MGWWTTKVRQAARHLTGRVSAPERASLDAWLSEPQRRLFDSMHRADQRHGLDVVARLRSEGFRDPDLLLAGLLHDCQQGTRGPPGPPRGLVARGALRWRRARGLCLAARLARRLRTAARPRRGLGHDWRSRPAAASGRLSSSAIRPIRGTRWPAWPCASPMRRPDDGTRAVAAAVRDRVGSCAATSASPCSPRCATPGAAKRASASWGSITPTGPPM